METSSSNILLWTAVFCFLVAFYKWATQNNDYFRKKGLKNLRPSFLIGNSSNLFTRKFAMCEYLVHIYEQFPQEKLFGVFQFRSPLFVLRDPDVIKQVGIKEFDNFMDHKSFISEEMDPLLGNALVALTGEKWRDMRATLSPVFTGSKMRNMFELVTKCGDRMAATFKTEAKAGEPLVYEMKDLFSRFTNDVVATSAFGIEINSFEDRENPFFTLGKSMMNFQTPIAGLKIVGFLTVPWLMKLLGVEFLNSVSTKYFTHIIRKNFQTREAENIVRNDVIQLLLQMRKGRLEHRPEEKAHDDAGFATVEESELGQKHVKRQWSEIELIAQCFIFFLAGFDTAATLLSFLAYELAVNPEVQQKLFEEIKAVDRSLNGEFPTYDTIQKMKYLDQVISEGLRKWPPAPLTDRQCVRTCNLTVDGKMVTIEEGNSLWVPIFALHHDEKYFPRPEVFDPERFSDENKANINPGAYLPFGIGPRNCIGSRFALMSAKAAVYHLLLDFSLEVTEKTDVPIKIAKTAAGFSAENGIHLEVRPR